MTNSTLIVPDFSASPRALPSDTPKQMLSVIQEGSGHTVRINSSSLSLLQTCARKSKYVLHDGWKGKAGSPPLIHGLGIHHALEVFYRQPRKERGEIPENFEEIAYTLANGYEAPEQHFLFDAIKAYISAVEPLRALPDSDARSLTSGIWVLCHYFRTYFHDVYVTHHDDKGPLIERTFETPLIDTPKLKVILFGTIDFILRNETTGHVLPGDHKTASQMWGFLNRVKPNHQYTGYVIGAQRVLGIDTEDFLVNGIEVKKRPAKGLPPTFTRQITKRTEQDIEEFISAVHFSVRNYLEWKTEDNWPLGHVDACSLYGGCGFHEICSAPNNLRQNILESKYTCNGI